MYRELICFVVVTGKNRDLLPRVYRGSEMPTGQATLGLK